MAEQMTEYYKGFFDAANQHTDQLQHHHYPIKGHFPALSAASIRLLSQEVKTMKF